MARIPFYLVSGFLGSGKTTLLKRILEQHGEDRRIAVVQNEFAPASVDGADLKKEGKPFEILEVNNGSVFCVCLLSSFIPSLAAFVKEVKPELVIMEASGLSDPIPVAEMLQHRDLAEKLYLAHIWSIVDVRHVSSHGKSLPRVQHQVRVADTVVLNKVDLVESLEEVRAWVKQLNPFASLQECSFCDFPLDIGPFPFAIPPVAMRQAEELARLGGSARPELEARVINTTGRISRARLEAFLASLEGKAYRVKGFVGLDDGSFLAVQCTFDQVEFEVLRSYEGPTQLIAIGPGLSEETFELP